MPNQPAIGVLQVEMQYLCAGEKAENVWHVHRSPSTVWPIADIEDVLSTFEDWESTTASLLRPTGVQLVNMVGTDLTSLNTIRTVRPVVPPVAGTITQDTLPNNATIAIKKDTGSRGHGQAGRLFWIGLAESQVTGNTLSTAARDGMLAALETLKNSIQSLGTGAYRLVVVHRVTNGVRPALAGTTDILGFEMADLTIDSQYVRLPNHKRRKRAA